MAHARKGYRITERQYAYGVGFVAEIRDPVKKRYGKSKTFRVMDYDNRKAAARRAAEYWAIEQASMIRAGVGVGMNAGKVDTSKALKQYIQNLEDRGSSKRYIADMKSRLDDLPNFLPSLGIKESGQIIYDYWRAWCREPVRHGDWSGRKKGQAVVVTDNDGAPRKKSANTQNSCLKNLRSFVAWCWKYRQLTGMQEPIDLSWIDKQPVDTVIKPQFTIDELRKGLATNHDYRIRWAIYTFLGLRAKEATELRWDDFRNGHVLIRKAKRSKRGSSQRIVAMQPELEPFLEEHRKKHDYEGYLFPDTVCRSDSLAKHLDHFLKVAGIPRAGRTTHSLRHGYAGLMTATGESTALVQAYMGHKQSDMTRHYSQWAAFYRQEVNDWPRGKIELMADACHGITVTNLSDTEDP